MEAPQANHPLPPATERANELLNSAGQRLLMFALQTRQRLKETVTAIRVEADHMDQPSQAEEMRAGVQEEIGEQEGRTEQPRQAPVTGRGRAEELIDRWTQRVSTTAAITSLQTRRIIARMREEAEDIWAEAQDIQEQREGRARSEQYHGGERTRSQYDNQSASQG